MRFYFHFCEDDGRLIDRDGLDLPDRTAALRKAVSDGRRMVGQEVIDGGDVRLKRCFEIEDECGVLVHRLTLADVIFIR